MALHLRHMLVRQPQRIGAKRRATLPIIALEFGNHRLATAGIAGGSVNIQRPVMRDQASPNQRPHQRQKARWVTARIADTQGLRDRGLLPRLQLGEAVGPVLCRTKRRRRVDYPRVRRTDQRHRLTRGGVGKAEDHEIGFVQRFAPRLGVLAARFVELDQREICAPGQPLANFQAGRSGGAIDEQPRAHAARSAPWRGRLSALVAT